LHAGRRGKGALRFELDGQDLTKADKRLTDAEIGRHLPLDLFERAVFYGQTEVSALLEVSVTRLHASQLLSRKFIRCNCQPTLRRSQQVCPAHVMPLCLHSHGDDKV